MMTTILMGVGGGILLEILGSVGLGGTKAATTVHAVGALARLLPIVAKLKDRMSEHERTEADAAFAEAERLGGRIRP